MEAATLATTMVMGQTTANLQHLHEIVSLAMLEAAIGEGELAEELTSQVQQAEVEQATVEAVVVVLAVLQHLRGLPKSPS